MNDGTCQVAALGIVAIAIPAIIALYFGRGLHAKGSVKGLEVAVSEPTPPAPEHPARLPRATSMSRTLKPGKKSSKRPRQR